MFVQVFEARVRDADAWARRVEAWRREIRPKTTGFLGFTSGVTADRDMITVVRFRSEETAKVDSDLAEQGAWFEETSKALDGEVTFHDCRDVDVLLDGGSDDAGFVQIMQGRTKDQAQMRAREKDMETELRKVRPDLIGATMAWHGDGTFTQAAYFTSEQDARKNERARAPYAVSAERTRHTLPVMSTTPSPGTLPDPPSFVLMPSEVSTRVGFFDRFAGWAAVIASRAPFFAFCLLLVVVWLVQGLATIIVTRSFSAFLDSQYQLEINTTTTIITFLLVASCWRLKH
jgi:hypothetical protein